MIFAKSSLVFWITALIICYVIEMIILHMLGGFSMIKSARKQFIGVTVMVFGSGLSLIYMSYYHQFVLRAHLNDLLEESQLPLNYHHDLWIYPLLAALSLAVGWVLYRLPSHDKLEYGEED